MMGYRTLLIDGDTVNPNIGFLLGINKVDVGSRQVLSNRVEMRDAMRKYEPTGIYLVLVIVWRLYLPDQGSSRFP